MLRSLFPRSHRKFLSLPLLGPVVEGFDQWLVTNAYTRGSRRYSIGMLQHVDADLRRRQIRQVADLTCRVVDECWRALIKTHPSGAGTVHALRRYLAANGLMMGSPPTARATSPISVLVEEYVNHLCEARGLAASTVSQHRYTAQCFLKHLSQERRALKNIQARHLESYIAKAGKRLSRASLQQDIGALRGFLRFLAMEGRVSVGIGDEIDTPRVHRLEQLPRALPWETVRALLRSVDRTSAMGLRDYAMFLLIATYGLRVSEIVTLTLDDFRWRQGILRIHQGKTASLLELPLTNEVSSAIVKHLKRTPPAKPYRRIFLRMRAPIGALKPTAVSQAFRSLVQKSGLRISPHGAHCLRHSLATHLLKSGTPLKTIGDILGHRAAESTSTYLRLATGDLREVPLRIPVKTGPAKEGQR
jgi:integrase/recombinase XerD